MAARPDPFWEATDLLWLALVQVELGDRDAARDSYRRALPVLGRFNGSPNDPIRWLYRFKKDLLRAEVEQALKLP